MPSVWTMGEMLVEIMRAEPGVPLGAMSSFRGPYPSGAPAIFIDTVARLGFDAGICGGVGNDAFGDCLVDRLSADGVDCSQVGRFTGSTAVAFVSYDERGGRSFIFHIAGTPAVQAVPEPSAFDPAPDVFHVMGCSLMADKRLRGRILDLAGTLAGRGTTITLDPNIRAELLGDRSVDEVLGSLLDVTAVLLPGRAELTMLAGETDIRHAAGVLFDRHDIRVIALKNGKSGATIITRDETIDIASDPIVEVDPTGAGDCFDAGFVCAYLEGLPLEQCGRIGAACGAVNATAFGPMEGAISRSAVGFPQ